ncbi:MAG TPA: thiamine phosphate synthase [Blastocatellia bacterium]|nr:thiamine phosphate synthase [Blastocatellia bacterium]
MTFTLPRLYAITDTRLSGLTHAEQVERLAAGGATLVQLRDKLASPRELYEAARAAAQVARALGVCLIINDRVDIALAVNADGVHLGQDDLPPERARALLGPQRILGYSTHNVKQALEADSTPVDYVAVGPIFQTTTKANPDPVVGPELIAELKSRLTHPLVAIGGITLESAPAVIAAGADSVAIISDLYAGGDIAAQARKYLQRLCAI